MAQNPVERNFVTRFVLGLGVILAMMAAGGLTGQLFSTFEFPYATAVGVFIGALAAFVVFAAWYTRYDASWTGSSSE